MKLNPISKTIAEIKKGRLNCKSQKIPNRILLIIKNGTERLMNEKNAIDSGET